MYYRTKGFSKNGTFESDAYRSVLSLVTNVEKQSLQDLITRSAEASFTLYYLATRTDIFGSSMKDLSELIENTDAIFVEGLILSHLQLIPPNAHSFMEEYKMAMETFGEALMPFLSLINHSCNPNILRVTRPGHTIVYATYPIKKDEQIFDKYGQLYDMVPKSMRHMKLLKQYCFTCDCVACVEDWPLFHELKSKEPNLGIEVLRMLQNFPKCARMANEGNVFNKDMIDDLLQMFQRVYNTLQMPHWAVAEISEILKRVYCLSGNGFDIPEL